MATDFLLRYDGLDAVDHKIDMRLLGRSLVGVDDALHRSFWAAIHPDIPRGRKRLDLQVQVHAPQAACVEVYGSLVAIAGVLPFAHEVATGLGVDYIKHMLSAMVFWHGGRRAEAEKHMEQALNLVSKAMDGQERALATAERMHEASLSAIVDVVKSGQPQARAIVAPVGPSANTLLIGKSVEDATVIDAAVADAVRSGEPLEVSDMQTMRVKVDGVVVHSRSIKVEDPDEPGRFITADVRDPAFTDGPNIYTEAVTKFLEVQAKATYRDGRLHRLHIMDAKLAA